MKKAFVLLLVFAAVLLAQEWSVELLPPPPEQFFMEQMWNCIVFNPEVEPVEVTLYGWVTHEGAEIVHARSNVILIPPGPRPITFADITTVQDEWYDPTYEKVIESQGALPAGVYTYCLEVESAVTGEVLAEDCGERRGVSPSPPKLLAPPDGSEVPDPFPTFIWAPPIPPQDVTYRLCIVEVPEELTPEEAIDAAEPWFEESEIPVTSFQYPVDARSLEESMEYAWQVNAFSGPILVGTSDTWAFIVMTAVPVSRLDSCQCYYDEETGIMWHGIGRGGTQGVPKDSCTYVVTVDGKLYHADGRIWTPQGGMTANDRCKLFLAKNGMFHFDGTKWVPAGDFYECNHVLAENGMFHFNGKTWVKISDDSCTYVYTVASSGQGNNRIMYHYNGTTWEKVAARKCQLYVAINGLYHFDGIKWIETRLKKCNAVKAENGMFHFNGSTWVRIPDDSCTYVHTVATSGQGDTPVMYHYDGIKWNRVQETECEIYRAYNGMFHYDGRKWHEIKPEKCKGVLAENGMYHFNGTEWVRVREDSCTYIFTSNSSGNGETPIMYHFDGSFWRTVRSQRCQLYRAYNGMFHFGRNGWKKIEKFKTCNHVLAENGMYHFNGSDWDRIPDVTCTHVYTVASTREGYTPHVYHYNGTQWEMIRETAGTRIEAINGTYRYDGRRWIRER
ncbi:hypothetical protein JXM67_11465 [candidate division WOR-3 bacterium]|nr:hypothetical protein [candidate division WOR-3 bacterium]